MVEIINTFEDDDIEWTYQGHDINTKELLPEESIFEIRKALGHLLLNEVILINQHWWMDDWPEEAKQTTVLAVLCGSVFVWASADTESITIREIELLYRMWKHDPDRGAHAWCVYKRKSPPQKPVRENMEKLGWDIDFLLAASEEELLARYRAHPNVRVDL